LVRSFIPSSFDLASYYLASFFDLASYYLACLSLVLVLVGCALCLPYLVCFPAGLSLCPVSVVINVTAVASILIHPVVAEQPLEREKARAAVARRSRP
jgi:hypothetical protein